jgi:hypothetical protein
MRITSVVMAALLSCGVAALDAPPAAAQAQTAGATAAMMMVAERQMLATEAFRAYAMDLDEAVAELAIVESDVAAERQSAIERLRQLSSPDAAAQMELDRSAEISRVAERLERAQEADRALTGARAELTERHEVVTRLAQAVERAQSALWLSAEESAELAADLEDALFVAADALDDRVVVELVSLPRDSATVFYQTTRARERGDAPGTLPAPTNRSQRMVRGCYYVWARWRDGTITDRNRSQCFDADGIKLTLQ